MTELDDEDIIKYTCYILKCITPTGSVYLDRVYRNLELAKKRQEYLSKISGQKGSWSIHYSKLGR